MRRILVGVLLLLSVTAFTQARDAAFRSLSFEERVEAQRAIERVYYSHQSGAVLPFEETVTREILEEKVRSYLKESAALDRIWKRPVTAEMLRREAERIARNTRMPERLRQLYAALGNDPFFILECLARPALVERLTRSAFASDQEIHARARAEAEAIRLRLVEGHLLPTNDEPHRNVAELRRLKSGESRRSAEEMGDLEGEIGVVRLELDPETFTRLRERAPRHPGEVGGVTETPDSFVVSVVLEETPERARIADYSVPKVSWEAWWNTVQDELPAERDVAAVAGVTEALPDLPAGGEGFDPAGAINSSLSAPCAPDDTWDNGILDDMPDLRSGHTAVWTGSVMIVWGGIIDALTNTGAKYDPLIDTWAKISRVGAPEPRYRHTAIWTGSSMIVWGGSNSNLIAFADGGRYDPATDTWTATSSVGAPAPRSEHTAIWTGTRMIIWGGEDSVPAYLNSGGVYDPVADVWAAGGTSLTGAPSGRTEHTAIWTGSRMVVWGGRAYGAYANDGGRYDPASHTWSAGGTNLTGAPAARNQHAAVWTGSLMIVWGGMTAVSTYANSGGRYDPVANLWVAGGTSLTVAPIARAYHTAVWTGTTMIIWGGYNGAGYLSTGGRYDPGGDTWLATKNFPSTTRAWHTAVWTGLEMVVWGGRNASGNLSSILRYDPILNDLHLGLGPIPLGRERHTAVWTGNVMVVWGGVLATGFVTGTGGKYDPALDTWSETAIGPTSTGFSADSRRSHSAVWTGTRMLIWGGFNPDGYLDSGGSYDPLTDKWTEMTWVGAPAPRFNAPAVWTGSRMLVWGGYALGGLNTGGSYDPAHDTWTAISGVGAPSARFDHSAVWANGVMVVWGGGTNSTSTNTGGRYDPNTDTWSSTSMVGVPAARMRHATVWTGSEMIVWSGLSLPFTSTYLTTGGRYNPVSDSWLTTSLVGVPPLPRESPSAVWTGREMVVWGGMNSSTIGYLDTGGRYDPSADTWSATSIVNAPAARGGHTTVWTGSEMIVWGGTLALNSGGRYSLGLGTDDDGDGVSECAGDCNDASASVFPGGTEICDGLDDDCDGVIPSGEVDADGDGFRDCGGDCDDTNRAVFPGNPESCDGLDNNCNSQIDELDTDGDGVGFCFGDCNDADPGAIAAPGLITNMTAMNIPGGTRFMWDSQGATAGTGTRYDIFSGRISLLGAPVPNFASGSCLSNDDNAPSFDYVGPPPPVGDAFYFLIRAQNSCGTASYGDVNRDTTTARSATPCF